MLSNLAPPRLAITSSKCSISRATLGAPAIQCILLGLAVSALALPSYAAIVIFGQPLGGVVKISRQCGTTELDPKNPCWVGKPFRSSSGALLGSAALPGLSTRPEWAAYAMFDLTLEKDGTLSQIHVKTFKFEDRIEIAKSIRERWGLPKSVVNLPGEMVAGSDWETPDLFIQMTCGSHGCNVRFRPMANEATRRTEAEAAKAKRSTTP